MTSQIRFATIPADTISYQTGLCVYPCRDNVEKYISMFERRGNIIPVTVTPSRRGSFEPVHAEGAYGAYRAMEIEEIPVVIAETEGGEDALRLILELYALQPSADKLIVSSAVCRLIDQYDLSRREIAGLAGKSVSWLSLMERLERNLSSEMKELVAAGRIGCRSAMEIARLPEDVQVRFTENVFHFNVAQIKKLVEQYAKGSHQQQEAIINNPAACLIAKTAEEKDEKQRFADILRRCHSACIKLEQAVRTTTDSVIVHARQELEKYLDLMSVVRDRILSVFDLSQKKSADVETAVLRGVCQ